MSASEDEVCPLTARDADAGVAWALGTTGTLYLYDPRNADAWLAADRQHNVDAEVMR